MMRGNPRRTFAALLALAAAAMLAACEKVTLPPDQDGKVPDLRLSDLVKADRSASESRLDGSHADLPSAKPWVISAGGAGPDRGHEVLDESGNPIITGTFAGSASFGTTTLTAKGTDALFAAKLDPSGQVTWAVPIDGTFLARNATGHAVDGSGNVYVAGGFSGTLSVGALTVPAKGETDVFVVKLDPTGKPLWAVSAGGPGTGASSGRTTNADNLAVDSAGNATIAGEFLGTLTFGSTSLTAKGISDGFVARLDPSGKFVWAVQLGSDSTSGEGAYGVAVDGSGNVTTGAMISKGVGDAPASFGTLSLAAKANFEICVAKLDSSGKFVAVMPASTQAVMVCGWSVPQVYLDGAGNTYLAGGAFYPGPERPFVIKYGPAGNTLWAWDVAGPGSSGEQLHNAAQGLLIDSAGALTVVGAFTGTKQFGSQSFTASGEQDVFLVGLDSAGKLTSARQLGGPGKEWANPARDKNGNLYLGGGYEKSITIAGTTLTSKGDYDIYLAKLPPGSLP
jgi:hypothetical protein